MSSNQINFFHHVDDLEEIRKFLYSNEIIIVKQPLTSLNDINFNSINLATSDKEFDKVYLTTLEFKNELALKYVPKMGYHVVDDLRSAAIEFTRGVLRINKLTRGRLYYVKSYYDDSGNLKNKNNEKKRS